jgi:hypothetical protein
MKTWVVIFLSLLAAGVAWGIARDLFSRQRGTMVGVVTAVDLGNAIPKWVPAAPPRYTVRLPDGRMIDAATKTPRSVPVGGDITITEWVTPWGQVWYTQRD